MADIFEKNIRDELYRLCSEKAWGGKGRSPQIGVLDTISPLIDEIAKLRREVDTIRQSRRLSWDAEISEAAKFAEYKDINDRFDKYTAEIWLAFDEMMIKRALRLSKADSLKGT